MQTGDVDYDRAANNYVAHRRIHPGVFRELRKYGGLGVRSKVLEVGCGTGNYIRSLVAWHACTGLGLDPSVSMLEHAVAQPGRVLWLQGRAECQGLCASSVDLLFSVDVIHHVSDKAGFYQEAARLLRPGGQVCTVTDSEDMIRRREILSGFFPETVEAELVRYPCVADLEAWMTAAGLTVSRFATAEAPYELTGSKPFRDKAYSSLHLITEGAWRAGLARLERALAKGPVRGMSRYACLWGRKPRKW
jgi:SAM-dependent methyltransferase